jgi:hypothetical protein
VVVVGHCFGWFLLVCGALAFPPRVCPSEVNLLFLSCMWCECVCEMRG